MSSSFNESEKVLLAIKGRLSELNLKYQDVATRMSLSLPTIKRNLSKGTMDLKFLLRLCEILDLTPTELMERAEKSVPKTYLFDEKEDEFFFENPKILVYFALLGKGETPQSIATQFNLSKFQTTKYLSALENHGFIEVWPHNKIRLKIKPPFGFRRNSKVLKRDLRQMTQEHVDKIFENYDVGERNHLLVKPFTFDEETFQRFTEDLGKLLDTYSRVSVRLEKKKGATTFPVLWASLTDGLNPEIPYTSEDLSSL